MIDYYIVIDSIEDKNLLSFRIYEFNPEVSLKPIRINSDKCDTVYELVNIIEDIVHAKDNCTVYILNSDEFLRNIFDNNIDEFIHIKIKYGISQGFRVFYSIYGSNGCEKIELLDTSAPGLFRCIRKIKIYA